MKRAAPTNIATDPIGAVLILSGPPTDTNAMPAILLRSDGSATALHAIPGADGVWSLSEPIEQLTPEKVRQCFLGMTAIRREAAQEIDRLIALLDRLGPDPELEENGDNDADDAEHEPSLGSVDNFTNQTHWTAGGSTSPHALDLEGDEHDGREPDEVEASLGSLDSVTNQTKWADGYHPVHTWEVDLEDQHDGCEPSLGSTVIHDQTMWHAGSTCDREQDAGDERELEDHA